MADLSRKETALSTEEVLRWEIRRILTKLLICGECESERVMLLAERLAENGCDA